MANAATISRGEEYSRYSASYVLSLRVSVLNKDEFGKRGTFLGSVREKRTYDIFYILKLKPDRGRETEVKKSQ